LRGQRPPVGGTREVELGFDRLGDQREGEPRSGERACSERRDRRHQRGEWTGRRLCRALNRGDLALAERLHQRPYEPGLGGEVAIDRAGGDAGALGDRRDLHRRHAAFGGGVGGRGQDGGPSSGQPAGDVFRATIGHGKSASVTTNEL
jgi:hypothetical protein